MPATQSDERSSQRSFPGAGADWAACHFPGGPVGTPARWAATSNVEGGSGTEEEAQLPLAREGKLPSDKIFVQGTPSS